jgi:hypothetical protein
MRYRSPPPARALVDQPSLLISGQTCHRRARSNGILRLPTVTRGPLERPPTWEAQLDPLRETTF